MAEEKNKGGRPLKFESVEELEKKIDAYFAACDPHTEMVTEYVEARDKDGKLKKDEHGLNYLVEITHMVRTEQIPYTITGLALALDTTRETLLEYEGRVEGREQVDEGFADTIKKAKQKCHNYAEQRLFEGNPAGTIFSLKNNYGWRDKSEVEGTGEQKIIVETRKYDANDEG